MQGKPKSLTTILQTDRIRSTTLTESCQGTFIPAFSAVVGAHDVVDGDVVGCCDGLGIPWSQAAVEQSYVSCNELVRDHLCVLRDGTERMREGGD
jgi:hypothetical protein